MTRAMVAVTDLLMLVDCWLNFILLCCHCAVATTLQHWSLLS